MPSTDITVSVVLTTYNHAPYIAQAIDGVLMQRAPFAWELLIGEDCSTDGTAAVVQEYAERDPNRIRAFIAERNEGGHVNFERLIGAARGRYIAWVEGDDYWTDHDKLRKQVALLDADPELVLCFHRAELAYEKDAGRPARISNRSESPRLTIRDLGLRNSIRTPTVMFRNGVVDRLPPWFHDLPVGDWPLFVLLAQHGDVGFIDETMCVRRIHSGGAWTSLSTREQLSWLIHTADVMRRNIDPRYRPFVNKGYLRFCRRGVSKMLRRGDLVSAGRCFVRLAGGALSHPLLLHASRRPA